jgi:succinoglycan biosynthesis transport protein ExoP
MNTAMNSGVPISNNDPRLDQGEKSLFLRERQFDIRQLLLTLWRRKLLIFGTTFFVSFVGLTILMQVQPLYTATVKVMIETRQNKVANIEGVVSALSPELAAVLGEVEVIQSSKLLKAVIDKMGLDGDPEFNLDLNTSSFWKKYFDWTSYFPKTFLRGLGLAAQENYLNEEELKDSINARVVEEIKRRLSVQSVRRSRVINISFTSEDKRKAARIANTISDLYIVDQLEAKFEATKRATSWLSDRLNSLKQKVESAEQAVEIFRNKAASQIGQRSKITAQQISGLNTQLVLAQTKKAEAKARLDQVERLLRAGGRNMASAAEVLNSMLIQRLRAQEAEVVRKVSELDSRYGPRHPRMIKAQNELRDLRTSIETEVEKIAQSLRNEVVVADAREATLQRNLDRLEDKNTLQNRAAIRLRELEREANASQILYSNFLNRFKETSSQEDLQQADARIISKATIPAFASFPRKGLSLAFIGIGGFILGVFFVFVLEHFRSGFVSTRELEANFAEPILGVIPKVNTLFKGAGIANFIIEKEVSSAAESVRNLSTAIRLSNVDSPPKVVCFISTTPSEGKTTLAVWLAQQTALSGKKVLLIDCDLRRPTVHNALRMENETNLIDFLAGDCALEDVIKKVEESGLHVILGANAKGSATDILGSQKMDELIATMRDRYDLVVIDSPPILAVADTRLVASRADKVIYVVRWRKTPKDLVKEGVKLMAQSGLSCAGILLTQVDTKKQSGYGYYDYGYYYGKYKGYYNT